MIMAISFWSRKPSHTARGRKTAASKISFRAEAAAVGFIFAMALRPSKEAPIDTSARGEAIVPKFCTALFSMKGSSI